MGLPEVNLGLLPGAGGTVRLPRLTDTETALTMITGGKPIGVEAAERAGIVDRVEGGEPAEIAQRMARVLRDGELPVRVTRELPADLDRAVIDRGACQVRGDGRKGGRADAWPDCDGTGRGGI